MSIFIDRILALKRCVGFADWILKSLSICSTLVPKLNLFGDLLALPLVNKSASTVASLKVHGLALLTVILICLCNRLLLLLSGYFGKQDVI